MVPLRDDQTRLATHCTCRVDQTEQRITYEPSFTVWKRWKAQTAVNLQRGPEPAGPRSSSSSSRTDTLPFQKEARATSPWPGGNGMEEPGAHGRIMDIPRLLLPSPGAWRIPTGGSNRRTSAMLY